MSGKTLDSDWSVLTTVNASLREPVTGDDLVGWIRSTKRDARGIAILTILFTECSASALSQFLRGRKIAPSEAYDAVQRFVRPMLRTDKPLPIDLLAFKA